MIHNSTLRNKANAFLIWREGYPVKWDCTVRELVEATGISRTTVARICRERGWPVQRDDRTDTNPKPLTDTFGRMGNQREPRRNTKKDPVSALQKIIEETRNYGRDESIAHAN